MSEQPEMSDATKALLLTLTAKVESLQQELEDNKKQKALEKRREDHPRAKPSPRASPRRSPHKRAACSPKKKHVARRSPRKHDARRSPLHAGALHMMRANKPSSPFETGPIFS